MATDTTYNGWTNREAWLVGVWDFFDYDEIKEVLRDTVADNRILSSSLWIALGFDVIASNPELGGIERALTLYLADWLEHEHSNVLYDLFGLDAMNGYLLDHLLGSIEMINWLEIAEHYSDEIKEVLGVTA